jgi:diguanylate cyclase (GGDEF)-like protein/PAS domain S-box-containing protein
VSARGEHTAEHDASFYRTLAQCSMDMVLVIDAEGETIYANPAAQRLTGHRREDFSGHLAIEVVHPDDREALGTAFEQLLAGAGETEPIAFRLSKADGTWLDVEAVASNQLSDPAVSGIVVNVRDIRERVRAEREIRETDARYRTMTDALLYGALLIDGDGRIILANQAMARTFGVAASDLVGRVLVDLIGAARSVGIQVIDEEGTSLSDYPVLATLRTGEPRVGAVHGIVRADGTTTWVRINALPVLGEQGVEAVAASVADITQSRETTRNLREALSALRQERTFLQVLLDNLEEGIVACDADGRLTLFNPASRRFHGIPDEVNPVGRTPSSAGLRRSDGSAMAPEENPLLRALAGEEVREAEIVVENRHGERRVVVANGQALYDEDGRKLGAVIAMHDVTEHKRQQEQLAELALRDPLTGVANRHLLSDRLRGALDRMRRGIGGVGLLLLDLDEFKEVNDDYGHDVGDDVLIAVARRIQSTIRPQDTVARLGGDEFVVVCEVDGGQEEVDRIAERVTEALAEPYRLDDRSLTVLASVGGVLVENPNVDPSKLLSLADDQMYRVKANHRRDRRARADRQSEAVGAGGEPVSP